MAKEKKIKIWIEAKTNVHFNQQVEVTQEQYDKLKHLDLDDVQERDDPQLYSQIEGLIDFSDILDSDKEFTYVRISKKQNK